MFDYDCDLLIKMFLANRHIRILGIETGDYKYGLLHMRTVAVHTKSLSRWVIQKRYRPGAGSWKEE